MLLYLTGKDPSSPPEDWLLRYRLVDGEEVATAMPVFEEFGLVQARPPPPPTSLVDLSSSDHSSEATEDEGEGESSFSRQRELLRDFPDDDDDDAPPWWRRLAPLGSPRDPGWPPRSSPSGRLRRRAGLH